MPSAKLIDLTQSEKSYAEIDGLAEEIRRTRRPRKLHTVSSESARACSYYSVSAGSNSGTPRLCKFWLYYFWLYQSGFTSVVSVP